MSSLIEKYKEFPDHVFYHLYRRKLPRLVAAMRAKPKIKVLFVVHCLDKWKTEGLMLKMLAHPRFEPVMGVAMSCQDYPAAATKKYSQLVSYAKSKGYDYRELCGKADLDAIAPDIIFYIEPYNGVINRGLEFRNAPNALFCFSTYGLHTVHYDWSTNLLFHRFLWHEYYENSLAAETVLAKHPHRKRNIQVIGSPFVDLLLAPAESDPWKPQDKPKKRIIYAPHYSIDERAEFNISTFLTLGEEMLKIAEETADTVQWAFKPHPSLMRELAAVWGEERAQAYYAKWDSLPNAQYYTGQYLDLFKHSDALVHDCSSFICEYLYMHKPVLFLDKGTHFNTNAFGEAALKQHYMASNAQQVRQFISNVCSGKDDLADQREAFFANHLLLPAGQTAADNIIAAILGE